MESTLLGIGNLVILSTECIGYLPLAIKQNIIKNSHTYSLKYQIGNLPWLWCSFLIILIIFDTYYWMDQTWNTDSVWKIENDMGPIISTSTGELAAILTGLTVTVTILCYRVHGLVFGKSVESQWQKMCQGIEEIAKSDTSSHRFDINLNNSKHTKIFLNIKKSLRNTFGIFSLISSVYVIVNLSTFYFLPSLLQYTSIGTFFLSILPFLVYNSWGFLAQIHCFFSLWIIFPIKIFTGCVEMISKEMDEIEYCNPEIQTEMNQFILVRNSPSLQTVVDVSEKSKSSQIDEQTLRLCIENYYRVSKLLKSYNFSFGRCLIIEIMYNTIIILSHIFMTINFFKEQQIFEACMAIFPTIPSLLILHNLSSNASRLSAQTDILFDHMSKLPHHILNDDLREKVKFLTLQISSRPLSIEPGSYFTLNRRLITSVLSVIMTFIIVLIQFRDGEFKKVSIND